MTNISITRSPYYYQRHQQPNARILRRQSKVDVLKLKFEFGPKVVIIGLFALSVLLVLIYLARFNQDATKGYVLRRLEADRQQLLSQHNLSDMHLAETKTLDTISHSDKVVHMREVASVTFVPNGSTALASADRL